MSLRRDAHLLVVPLITTLPDQCVKCSLPANGFRIRRQFYRQPPWYARIFPVNLLYTLFALFLQRKIIVQIGLCPNHRRRRFHAIMIGEALALMGFAAMLCGSYLQMNSTDMGPGLIGALIGLTAGIAGSFWAIRNHQVLALKKVEDDAAWFSGAGSEFLRSIPSVD